MKFFIDLLCRVARWRGYDKPPLQYHEHNRKRDPPLLLASDTITLRVGGCLVCA